MTFLNNSELYYSFMILSRPSLARYLDLRRYLRKRSF